MKTKLRLFALLLAVQYMAGCASAGHQIKAVSPDSEVVVAEGSAPVVNGDASGAKKTALHDAMKAALGLVIGVYVSQESLVSKAMLIEDNITSQTEGYIEKYDVLKEWQEGDFYKIRIKALVRKEDLSAKIKALDLEPKKLGNPVVKFSLTETVDGAASGAGYALGEVKNVFVQQGFIVSGSGASDITVEGSADANFNTKDGLGGLYSYRASCSLKAEKTDSKDAIANVALPAGGVDVTKEAAAKASLVNAAKRSAGDLAKAVIKFLRERSTVILTVSNVGDLNKLNSFTRSLRALIEVRDCWVRSYENGTAAIEMDLKKGSAREVAKRMEDNTNFSIKIKKTGAYSIDAEIKN